MAGKIRKADPPPFVVVPDTNILWHEDKSHAVNPAFDEFWDRYSEEFQLELTVPEIVAFELLFQQTTSAARAMERIGEELKRISSITAKSHGHRLTTSKLKDQISNKLQRWIKSRKATVSPTPVSAINWIQLIDRAVWGKPPFSFDPKDAKNEKGFRDALILETFKGIVITEKRNVNLVFLTDDALLKKAVEDDCKSDSRCFVYETLDDFSSYLRLTKEKLTDAFIKSLLTKARAKFFSHNDQSCIYYKDNVKGRIQADFKEKFEHPEFINTQVLRTIPGSQGPDVIWESGNEGRWWIFSAAFDKLIGEKQYHWVSQVTFVRPYASKQTSSNPSAVFTPEARWLVLPFFVSWWANIKADGRFHDMTIESISLKGETFKPPTQEQLKLFKLDKLET